MANSKHKSPIAEHSACVLLVAVGEYDHHDPLPLAREAAEKLAQILVEGGYRHDHPQLLNGGEKNAIEAPLYLWLRQSSSEKTLLLYWTGHGISDGSSHYLATRETPVYAIGPDNAIDSSMLGKVIANSPAEKILVVLDTCYAGVGANELLKSLTKVLALRTPLAGRKRAIAVIASVHPLQRSREASFCNAFRDVLMRSNLQRRWSDEDRNIHTDYLADAVADELNRQGIARLPEYKAAGYGQDFILNPRYRGPLPAEDVETRYSRLARADVEVHFLPATKGIEVGEAGWYFTGRTRLLRELVQWLKKAEHGMFIVTGPPGAGKSAVMGRLVTLSDPRYRFYAEREGILEQAPRDTIPPAGVIDVAVHAKGKGVDDVSAAIANGLGLQLEDDKDTDVEAILKAVESTGRRITLLVDALDEAEAGHAHAIGTTILKPLAGLSNVRVLVGSRRGLDGRTIPDDEDHHIRLRALFGEVAVIRDMADEPKTEKDIVDYVTLRLANSKFKNNPESIAQAARNIAEKAEGIFLYARIVSRTLIAAETLTGPLPDSAMDAFIADLELRFGERQTMVDEGLRALAWGEGRGLTRRVWAPIAMALSITGTVYDDSDIDWVLANAGWHIIETGEQEQTAYRLVHQVFVDRYRKQHESSQANQRITRALTQNIKGQEWLNADRYLWRYIAVHAAIAGELDRLVQDPGFLAVVEPKSFVPVLTQLTDTLARRIADVYRTAVSRLRDVDAVERMARIHFTASQLSPDLAPLLKPVLPTVWKCRWAKWKRSTPHMELSGHRFAVRSVAMGELNSQAVIVSASEYNVMFWDALSGEQTGAPLKRDFAYYINDSVSMGELNGRAVIVSAGCSTVLIYDALSREAVGEVLGGHGTGYFESFVMGEFNGQAVIVSGGDDNTVRIWDALSGKPVGESLEGHRSAVKSVAMDEINGRTVIVSGSDDKTVRIWDTLSGKPVGEPLEGHRSAVKSVAMGEISGRTVIVSGSNDKTLRIWDALSGKPVGEPLEGHRSAVNSVAMGEISGRTVIVSGSNDNTVRIWDALSGKPVGEPLEGHEDHVNSVAMGELNGRAVIVSGSKDTTVRIWDTPSGKSMAESSTDRIGWATSVAMSEINGRTVIVSTYRYSSTVCVWDVLSGEAIREPWNDHNQTTVALGEINGRLMIASKNYDDNTVWVWDVLSGETVGKSLKGHIGRATSIALGEIKGRPVIITGSEDTTVRIWDVLSGKIVGKRTNFFKQMLLKALAALPFHNPELESYNFKIGERDYTFDSGNFLMVRDKLSLKSVHRRVNVFERMLLKALAAISFSSKYPYGERFYKFKAMLKVTEDDCKVKLVCLSDVNGRTMIVSSLSGQSHKSCTVRVWKALFSEPLDERANVFKRILLKVLDTLSGETVIVVMSKRKFHSEPKVTSVATGNISGRPVIVTGSDDDTIEVWDTLTGEAVGEPLEGHKDHVTSVAIGSLNGRPVIVSGSDDTTVRIWDANNYESIAVVPFGSKISATTLSRRGEIAVAAKSGIALIEINRII